MKTTHNNTIPFNIIGDERTVQIASAILQQMAESVYGTAKVTALRPAISKSHLYGSIVLWVHRSPKRTEELQRFYRDEWSTLPLQKREKQYTLTVRWHVSANDALTEISRLFPYKRFHEGNKSLAFCVIMAFAAKYRYRLPIPRD